MKNELSESEKLNYVWNADPRDYQPEVVRKK